jgi:hypothetical protein
VKQLRARIRRDERGTSLILAIAFLVVIGGISGALLSSVATGLSVRNALDQARNREYAADGLIDYAITQARAPVASWNTGSPPSVSTFLASASSIGCGPLASHTPGSVAWAYAPSLGNVPIEAHLNNVDIRVDCAPAPALTRARYLQRNAIFTACLDIGAACTNSSAIVRAQINFSDSGATAVQAWSVNG